MKMMPDGFRRITIEQSEEVVELRDGQLVSKTRRFDHGESHFDGRTHRCRSLDRDPSAAGVSVPIALLGIDAPRVTIRSVRDERTIELPHETLRRGSTIHYLTVATKSFRCSLLSTEVQPLLDQRWTRHENAIDPDEAAKLPLLFRNGTGAVVAHEAIGHPSELAPSPMDLTFEVYDRPCGSLFDRDFDDRGDRIGDANLGAGEQPKAFRVGEWRHLPIRRMTNLLLSASEAVNPPPRHLAIDLIERATIADGAVHLHVASAFIVDETIGQRAVRPFSLSFARTSFAEFRPASLSATTYPGVLCSAEGQRIPVGSRSIDLLFVGERSLR